MVTRDEIGAAFVRLLEGSIDRVLESFARHPHRAGTISVEDAVRWELIAVGESINGDSLLAKLREAEPDIEIEAYGVNREMGYIWARVTGGEANRDEESWAIPPTYFRFLSLLSGNPMTETPAAQDDGDMPIAMETV